MVSQHLIPEVHLGDGALYAILVTLVLLMGSRVCGGVRHSGRGGERLPIVDTSLLTRLVIEEIARRPHRYALVALNLAAFWAMPPYYLGSISVTWRRVEVDRT